MNRVAGCNATRRLFSAHGQTAVKFVLRKLHKQANLIDGCHTRSVAAQFQLYVTMANQNDPFFSQMIQAISSLNLSPEQLQDALHSPESMIELMGRASAQPIGDRGYAGLDENSIKQELESVEARWQEEARLSPQKPQATKRIDLEITNRDVSQEMSSENFKFLKTFVGNNKSFSTIPIKQLKIGT